MEGLTASWKTPVGGDLCEANRAKLVQHAMEAKRPTSAWLLPNEPRLDRDQSNWKRRDEASLRIAATFGQIEACVRLLEDHHINVDAVAEASLRTALHMASRE